MLLLLLSERALWALLNLNQNHAAFRQRIHHGSLTLAAAIIAQVVTQ